MIMLNEMCLKLLISHGVEVPFCPWETRIVKSFHRGVLVCPMLDI